MIAMMSVSFFLLGLIVLMVVAFFVGIAALVAVVTKRPGIVAVVGLVMLLGIGVVLASLVGIRSVAHSNVHLGTETYINTYPDVRHDATIVHPEMFDEVPMQHFVDGTMPMPQVMHGTISTPIGEFSGSGSTHYRAKLAVWPLLLFAAAIIAVVVAAISRRKSSGSTSGRGSWWPALLLVPLAGLFLIIALKVGAFWTYSRLGTQASDQTQAVQQNLAQLQLEGAHIQMLRAKEIHANQVQAEASRSVEALQAQLQRQFANMDINELIAIFEAPKIELSSTTTQPPAAPAPPIVAIAPPVPAAPVITAPVMTVSEQTASAVAEVAMAQDKVVEVAADQTKKEGGEKEIKPEIEKSSEEIAIAKASPAMKESKPLPDWVDDQPGMYGADWREVIATDEYATAEECRRAMDIYLMLKTAERIQTLVGQTFVDHNRPSLAFHQGMITADGNIIYSSGHSAYWNNDRLQLLQRMGIGIDEIRRSVVREQHLASRDSPRALDTMYKQYTLAQFTPWFDGQLRRHWDSYRRSERFTMVGVGASSVLGLLGFVFGLLKIDTWTKGYYTKRLFIGVPAMIIGGFALIVLIDAMG